MVGVGGTKPCLSPPVLCTLHSPLHLISGDILDPWCWEASVEPGGDRSGSLVQARDGQAEGNDPVGGPLAATVPSTRHSGAAPCSGQNRNISALESQGRYRVFIVTRGQRINAKQNTDRAHEGVLWPTPKTSLTQLPPIQTPRLAQRLILAPGLSHRKVSFLHEPSRLIPPGPLNN